MNRYEQHCPRAATSELLFVDPLVSDLDVILSWLRPEVEAYAEMVLRRRTPGDDLSEQAALRGPLAILEEEAHA